MTCDECENAKIAPMWRRRNVWCQYCAARAIWLYGEMDIPRDDKRTFRRQVIQDAVRHGLDEATIRRLWKEGTLTQPEPPQKRTR
jgi:hypothetical protein